MAKIDTERGRTLVYRPLGLYKRKLKQERTEKKKNCNYAITRRQYLDVNVYKTFDSINYKIFFNENNWDPNEDRRLHETAKIKKLGRFVRKKWLPCTDTKTYGMLLRLRKKFVAIFADLMIKYLIEDMIERDNKLIFSVYDNHKHVEGWYKIGTYIDKGLIKNFEQLIISIVPHKRERLSEYYPIIVIGDEVKKMLKKSFRAKKIEYESIDLQERIATHNRLSGFYRRVRQPSPNKKIDLQSGHRFKSRYINDNKDSCSGNSY